ncbi:MAG: hypothetical protein IJ574_00955 [Bacilli bacterium]|nr:hypothetical protein [Bacilli bacterium]
MKKIANFILAIFASFSLLINLDLTEVVLKSTNVNILTMGLLTILLYKLYNKNDFKKINILTLILSILFSIFMIVGYSFEVGHSFKLMFGNIYFIIITLIKLISFTYLFYTFINIINNYIFNKEHKDLKKNNKIVKLFNKHPFLFSLILILICWLPYIISFYPAILSPDPSNQVKQFFGIRTKYSDFAVMLDENVTITNHHPVFHTVLLGGCAKIGDSLGNVNLGLFIYSLLQTVILASTLAFTIKYLKKTNTKYKYIFIVLLMYAFVPVFPFYAMSPVKDVLFSCFITMYVIELFDLIRFNNYKWYNYLILFITMLLIVLQRQNGIYSLYLSFPFLFFIKLKNKKVLLLTLVLVVGLFYSYSKILLPHLKITDGSIREVLSIPFQQTARYVKTYPDEVTSSERKAIDKVLKYKTLAKRYDARISDPVKNKFNKYTTSDDLKAYFKVWFKQLKKHPVTYLEATIDNTYGYFYPNTTYWYIYNTYDTRLKEDDIDYHFNNLEHSRELLTDYGVSFPYIPLVGLFVNIGFTTWVYLYMLYLLIKEKKYRYIIVLTVSLSLILVCFASPVNTYFRYALPSVFSLPVTALMLLSLKSNNKCSNY